mmetsp:Transcript_7689/g.21893  ORF Transcript_7689/g.21893 Transcript_7689/m.21893 type:complete len:245 (-) Transcript_7689:1208-1942(-)
MELHQSNLGVSCGARRRIHDASLLPRQNVHQCGLAGVHAAKNADVCALCVRAAGWQLLGRGGLGGVCMGTPHPRCGGALQSSGSPAKEGGQCCILEVRGVRPRAVRFEGLANRLDPQLEARDTPLGSVADAGLAGVQLVVLTLLSRRQDGHHNVGSAGQCKLAPKGVDGLQGGCGGDVDVSKSDACEGVHDGGELHHLSEVVLSVDAGVGVVEVIRHPGPRLRDVGAHANHVSIHVLEEDEVVC